MPHLIYPVSVYHMALWGGLKAIDHSPLRICVSWWICCVDQHFGLSLAQGTTPMERMRSRCQYFRTSTTVEDEVR
jgi:hypothetical protein